LDSVPATPDDLIAAVTSNRIGVNLSLVQRLAQYGVRLWGLGKFKNTPACDLARSTRGLRVLLLAGLEGDPWRNSTLNLAKCFNGSTEIKKDLPLTGVMLHDATGEQEESYDRPVIEFFDKSLR